jgi:DNA mismatch repair protein MutL
MPIRVLPQLLVNQIAAGEVIERPASVVKELVENSLDGGASRIDVAVEEGGRRLIRVSDDGAGIAAGELALAVAPHATSKLAGPDDLSHIGTLGFRGEALASIASVSRLRLVSRARTGERVADAGAAIEASGQDVGAVKPCAAAPGTVVEVKELFFNTPARRKFLRAEATEFAQVSEILGRIAMAHPAAAFRLTHNRRVALELAEGQSRRERCLGVLGPELEDGLLEFELRELPARGLMAQDDGPPPRPALVWGLAGVPALARATAKFVNLYVNGRAIRDRNLMHAVREAYRGLMAPDKQPLAVVFLDMDPALVDVNVHPTKAEVRFREPSKVHGLVLAALRQRLLAADLTPTVALPAGRGFGGEDLELPGPGAATAFDPAAGGASQATSQFVDYFRRMAPAQKGFVYQQVREALAREAPQILAEEPQPRLPVAPQSDSPAAPAAAPPPLVLQVHNSYLVTQDADGILIIDQHALHERVMYEELRGRVLGRNLESQRLLMPVVVEVEAAGQALLESLHPLLERIGIEVQPIGPRQVAVHAFPTFLFDRNVDAADFLRELLDRAGDDQLDVSSPTAAETALHEVLDLMACKAAVKAGDYLPPEELSALLQSRDAVERSSNCPHGRPTSIRLTLRDLEKHFQRT